MAEPHPRLAENIVHFGRVLRRAGLSVGPRDILDAVEAATHSGLASRADFYWTLHATLVRSRETREIFDQAFHIFWRDPQLLDRMMALALPETRAPEEEPKDKALRRLAEALLEDRESPREEETELDIDARETVSAEEVLRTRDFEQMSRAELAEAKEALRHFRPPFRDQPIRRARPAPRGRQVDLRRTLQASFRGHDLMALKRKEPQHRAPPLVVLLDISGSMSLYARVFLHFLHAMTHEWDQVHAFLFGTRLTNITRHLRHRDIDAALADVSNAVEDWDGGTRIGETLRRFNVEWARRVLGQGAVVLLVTDGLDREGGEGLAEEAERLRRLSRRFIWLNPLLRYDRFEPKAAGIRALLPHVDEFRPVHNLESLSALVDALGDRAHIKRHRTEKRRAAS